jgi:proline dehydrogenase
MAAALKCRLTEMSVLSILARRFVAGETADDAVAAVRRLNSDGLKATLDCLGEDVTERAGAEAAAAEYERLLVVIADNRLDANVSLKLTQMGLGLDRSLCRDLLGRVLGAAASRGNFVRVDMEGSGWTQRTLDLVRELHPERGNVGVVIQAMLRRSPADIDDLNAKRIRVRLCKGAYKESAEVAFPDKKDVNRQYDSLADKLLAAGNYPAIATHDEERIRHAVEFASSRGLAKGGYELQMLFGLRRRLAKKLAAEGHSVRIYVPYGAHWLPYFSRRLRERKENLLFVLKGIWRD